MAKKEIIEINMHNNNEVTKSFKDGFLVALRRDGLSINGNKIYMETPNKIYTADFKQFAFVWHSSFESVFDEALGQVLMLKEAHPEMMLSLYQWTNPIFDKFPMKIEEKEKFLIKFKEKLENNKDYNNIIREAVLELIKSLSIAKRKDYIERFISFGVLDEIDKKDLGFYADWTPEELEKLFEEKQVSMNERVDIVSQAFVEERRKQNLSDKRNKQQYNSKIIKLINLLPVSEIADVLINDVISIEEALRSKMTKRDLLNLDYDMLLKLLEKRNSELPKEFQITSFDLIDRYGRNLFGNEIKELVELGYILPNDLIEIYETNRVLRILKLDKELFDDEQLKEYYTPKILIEMDENSLITPRFLELYLQLEDFENNQEHFSTKSKKLVDELKEDDEGQEKVKNKILHFYDIGLCDLETVKENVSKDDLEIMFVDNELTLDDIFGYFQRGLIGEDAISKYYDKKEILRLYEFRQIGFVALKTIRDKDFLLQAYCDKKINDGDFVRLYLESGNISINDLDDGIQFLEKDIDISSFITERTSFEKIRELFSHCLIDYSSILRLHNQGVIDDKQIEEIKSALSTREFFNDLKAGRTYKVVTTRNTGVSPRGKVIQGEREEKDFSDEISLISKILGKQIEKEKHAFIESYNSKGRQTSLNNYRIFGNEELDGIVILQKSKRENSVYVMNALQMMYFLKGRENSSGEIEIQNRMRDKAYLKTIEGVEVVEHTEYFARNLVEASARISPKIAEKVKDEDGKYISDVQKMADDMRRKYIEAKEKGRNDD